MTFTLSRATKCMMALVFIAASCFAWAQFASAADTINGSVYQDSDNDGTVDRILWLMDENVTACTYEAGDWTVNTASEMNFSITGLSCSGSDAYLYITVSADADETGSATFPVISYADNGTTGSVTLTSGNMGAHSSETVNDAADPVLSSVDFKTQLSSGVTYNAIELVYTEEMAVYRDGAGGSQISLGGTGSSSGSLGATSTARSLPGFGTWAASNGGDMVTNTNAGNTVSLSGDGTTITVILHTIGASRYSSGSTAPTTPVFTIESDANDLADLAGNAVNSSQSTVTATNTVAWDVTAPTISNVYSCDSDADGDIDRLQIDFSENMFDSSFTNSTVDEFFEVDNDNTNDGTGEESPSSVNTATGGCDGNADDTDADDDKMRIELTNGITGTDLAYLHVISGSYYARDHAGNVVATGDALGTEVDRAQPVVMSVTPSDGGSVKAITSFAMTFSEAMDTTFDEGTEFSVSPDNGSYSAAWSAGDTVVTVSGTFNCSESNTVTTTEANIDAASGAVTTLLTTGPQDGDWSFTRNCSSGGGSPGTVADDADYSVVISSPGSSIEEGTEVEITWSLGSDAAAVDLSYSTDGETYVDIATGITDDSYLWTVPSGMETLWLRLASTDGAEEVETDVVSLAVVTSDEDSSMEEDDSDDTSFVSSDYIGGYLRGQDLSTVYYIDEDLVRHPFLDAQTYFTHADSFDGISFIEDADLSAFELGAPMLPKAGMTLVKVQSLAEVYMVEENPDDAYRQVLRHIATEELAIELFGTDWADYVIDVPPTAWPRFTVGDVVDEADDIDVLAKMKKRAELAG